MTAYDRMGWPMTDSNGLTPRQLGYDYLTETDKELLANFTWDGAQWVAKDDKDKPSPADLLAKRVYEQTLADGWDEDDAFDFAIQARQSLAKVGKSLGESLLAEYDSNKIQDFINQRVLEAGTSAVADRIKAFRQNWRGFVTGLKEQALAEPSADKRISLQIAAETLGGLESIYLGKFEKVHQGSFELGFDPDKALSAFFSQIEGELAGEVPDEAAGEVSYGVLNTVTQIENQAGRRSQFDSYMDFYQRSMSRVLFDPLTPPDVRQQLFRAWTTLANQERFYREQFVGSGLLTPQEFLDPYLQQVFQAGTVGTPLAGSLGATALDSMSNILQGAAQMEERAQFTAQAGYDLASSGLPEPVKASYQQQLPAIFDAATKARLNPNQYLAGILKGEVGAQKRAEEEKAQGQRVVAGAQAQGLAPFGTDLSGKPTTGALQESAADLEARRQSMARGGLPAGAGPTGFMDPQVLASLGFDPNVARFGVGGDHRSFPAYQALTPSEQLRYDKIVTDIGAKDPASLAGAFTLLGEEQKVAADLAAQTAGIVQPRAGLVVTPRPGEGQAEAGARTEWEARRQEAVKANPLEPIDLTRHNLTPEEIARLPKPTNGASPAPAVVKIGGERKARRPARRI